MIISCDTETFEYGEDGLYRPVLNTNEFSLGCLMTDKGHKEFFKNGRDMYNRIKELCDKETKKGCNVYIYAHNMEYDYYAICKDNYFKDNIKYIAFSPFIAIQNRKVYWLDTMSFYRTSLKVVGEILGKEKLEMPQAIFHVDQLKIYLERDTQIVLDAMLKYKEVLRDKLGFKPRKMISSGQVAMTCFLTYCRREGISKTFMDYNVKEKRMEVVKTKYDKDVREAHRGGDNQAHKVGKFENVTLIDINGWYSKIMRDMRFPDLRSEVKIRNPHKGMFLKYLEKDLGIARIKFKINTTNHPVLPVRYGGYQIFKTSGEIKGTWTFMEIKEAINEGYEIMGIEWCIKYKELMIDGKPFNPLKGFIEKIYEIERECKSADEKLPIKGIRNNLASKWAQDKKSKDTIIVKRSEVQEYRDKGYESKGSIDDKYIMEKEGQDYIPIYVNPIITVLITAQGRVDLWKEEKKIPYKDRLYKDTDSLMFTDKNGDNLKKFKIGKELGEWKLEERNKPAKILGEKRYYIGDKIKFSGVSKRCVSKELLEAEEEIKTLKIKGIRSAMSNNDWDNVGTFREETRETKIHSKNMLVIPNYVNEVGVRYKKDNEVKEW